MEYIGVKYNPLILTFHPNKPNLTSTKLKEGSSIFPANTSRKLFRTEATTWPATSACSWNFVMMAGFPWAKTPVYRGIPTKTKNTKNQTFIMKKKKKNTGLVFHSTLSIRVFDGVFSNVSCTPKREMHRLIHGWIFWTSSCYFRRETHS